MMTSGTSPDQMGVIFDMDGVLVDSFEPHFLSWQQSARVWGLDMTKEQFTQTFGRTSRDIAKTLWGDKLSNKDIIAFDMRKEQEYRKIIRDDFPAMPGAPELITQLCESGFKLAIGSSGPAENVELVLECLKARDKFCATVNGSEVRHGKPGPDVFLIAADKMGLAPNRCCVVEDAPAGVQAAKSAHMAVVAITGTVDKSQLVDADMVIESLQELTPQIITSLIEAKRE